MVWALFGPVASGDIIDFGLRKDEERRSLGRGAATFSALEEGRDGVGDGVFLREPDAPDCATGTSDVERRPGRLLHRDAARSFEGPSPTS